MDVPEWTARELEIVSGLRELGDAARPGEDTRDRIRREIYRRLTEEPAPSRRRRVLANVLAAAAALVVALGGLGMVLSRNAMPGDPLYGVKRAAESAELGLTFGDAAKASKHLRFAATRLDELLALGSPDAPLVADFEREARAGATELTTLGVRGTGRELLDLRAWVAEQTAKNIPFPQVTDLLRRIDGRVQALSGRLHCYRITSYQADDLGPLPAADPCTPVPGAVPEVPGPATRAPKLTQSGAARSAESPSTPTPTGPVPPSGGGVAPTVINPPIPAPTSTPAPATTSAPPPLISIPPLLPGLPGIGIG
ncbi:MAG TPA: DUF5667 domain-containing protein [Amycolatopsis sp.]|uniref:DUF5667 domain-containing protein n=1 Tax=Amycolatopsis sp. TaxID=37632 RepID=UPI002B4A4AE3|nr:DUF5667 domain-containing protein [Amycolatopsis sp.]HKS48372.1 DUF5667 domain-containing protein [Amycolatopsis sp.]